MGNRVDLRVVTSIDGAVHNVSTCEFANAALGPAKFSNDHQKVLQESKVILDSIANTKYVSNSEARRLIIPRFQAAGLDGELKVMKLVAPGLYTDKYIGFVQIPNHFADLQLLSKKCIPSLNFIKNAFGLVTAVKKETRAREPQSLAYQRSTSYDSDSKEGTRWTSNPNSPIIVPFDML
ncbi:hypothetical protein CLU79DRAFT_805724 [Phycomyces nitens]|nr:hypothetical protein CLU79DRAFT_805724 [Phycomyces nitens]